MTIGQLDSIEAVEAALRDHDYICDRSLATVIFLSLHLAPFGRTFYRRWVLDVITATMARHPKHILHNRL
jgi:hypothetical protein